MVIFVRFTVRSSRFCQFAIMSVRRACAFATQKDITDKRVVVTLGITCCFQSDELEQVDQRSPLLEEERVYRPLDRKPVKVVLCPTGRRMMKV